jgi:hypothetical protein
LRKNDWVFCRFRQIAGRAGQLIVLTRIRSTIGAGLDVVDLNGRRCQLCAAIGAAATLKLRELGNYPLALADLTGAAFFGVRARIGLSSLAATFALVIASALNAAAYHVSICDMTAPTSLASKISLEAENYCLSTGVGFHDPKMG